MRKITTKNKRKLRNRIKLKEDNVGKYTEWFDLEQ